MFSDFRRDLRYAVRMLARTPATTVIIFLTLALGIGANAVIFTAVDAVLLRSAPVADALSLVSVYTGSSDGRDPILELVVPRLRNEGQPRDCAPKRVMDKSRIRHKRNERNERNERKSS